MEVGIYRAKTEVTSTNKDVLDKVIKDRYYIVDIQNLVNNPLFYGYSYYCITCLIDGYIGKIPLASGYILENDLFESIQEKQSP